MVEEWLWENTVLVDANNTKRLLSVCDDDSKLLVVMEKPLDEVIGLVAKEEVEELLPEYEDDGAIVMIVETEVATVGWARLLCNEDTIPGEVFVNTLDGCVAMLNRSVDRAATSIKF